MSKLTQHSLFQFLVQCLRIAKTKYLLNQNFYPFPKLIFFENHIPLCSLGSKKQYITILRVLTSCAIPNKPVCIDKEITCTELLTTDSQTHNGRPFAYKVINDYIEQTQRLIHITNPPQPMVFQIGFSSSLILGKARLQNFMILLVTQSFLVVEKKGYT